MLFVLHIFINLILKLQIMMDFFFSELKANDMLFFSFNSAQQQYIISLLLKKIEIWKDLYI